MKMELSNRPEYITKDYSEFKKLLGNRDVTERRVNGIIYSIKTEGYHPVPIVVNKNMEIIDGQGRVEACKNLGLPLYFHIDENANINTCIAMNLKAETWNFNDFLKSYAERGFKDYVIVKELSDSHPYLSAIVIASAFAKTLNEHGVQKKVKEGTYQIKNYSFGMECIDFYENIHKSVEKINCKKATLYSVIQGLLSLRLIDSDRMIEAINKYHDKCGYIGDVDSALESLQEIYNFNRRTKSFFKDAYKENTYKNSTNNIRKVKNNGR